MTAPNDGWIAVHAFQADGKLIVNQVVGTAQVRAGTSTNVQVTLNESFKPGDMFCAVALHQPVNIKLVLLSRRYGKGKERLCASHCTPRS